MGTFFSRVPGQRTCAVGRRAHVLPHALSHKRGTGASVLYARAECVQRRFATDSWSFLKMCERTPSCRCPWDCASRPPKLLYKDAESPARGSIMYLDALTWESLVKATEPSTPVKDTWQLLWLSRLAWTPTSRISILSKVSPSPPQKYPVRKAGQDSCNPLLGSTGLFSEVSSSRGMSSSVSSRMILTYIQGSGPLSCQTTTFSM